MNSIELVDVWEDGRCRNRLERPAVLLTVAHPGTTEFDWMNLPIGQRDEKLFDLQERLFGETIDAASACPNCKENLEVSMLTTDIRVPPPSDLHLLNLELQDGKYWVRFRLPTTSDLAIVAQAECVTEARTILLERCVVEARRSGSQALTTKLPEKVRNSIVQKMGAADPQAVIELALECPSCQHQWSLHFDICSYLWSEIEELALRLLREVHVLARAYGWSELQILGLSPLRRQVFLDLVGS